VTDAADQLKKLLELREEWSAGQRVPMGEVLKALEGRVNPSRSLSKLGLRRKKVDRFMARKAVLDTELVADLSRLNSLLEGVVLRQETVARDGALDLVERLYPSGEPLEVQVRLEGPDWLDPGLWIPESGRVRPRHARWLLQHLDALSVGGEVLCVHCEPEIRAGKRPQNREPEAVRRNRLFSRWSEGIQIDEEGLFSLTPEALALDMVKDLSGVVVDGTCGLGGLAIAAARNPQVSQVVAIDSHAERLKMAAHNAQIYGVADRIDFRLGKTEELLGDLAHDALILDPPWGGVNYDRSEVGVEEIPMPLAPILELAQGRVLLKLPRSFTTSSLSGDWKFRPAVDARGILKFLIAER